MLNFDIKRLNFDFKMLNFAFKRLNFDFKRLNFDLKMLNSMKVYYVKIWKLSESKMLPPYNIRRVKNKKYGIIDKMNKFE